MACDSDIFFFFLKCDLDAAVFIDVCGHTKLKDSLSTVIPNSTNDYKN